MRIPQHAKTGDDGGSTRRQFRSHARGGWSTPEAATSIGVRTPRMAGPSERGLHYRQQDFSCRSPLHHLAGHRCKAYGHNYRARVTLEARSREAGRVRLGDQENMRPSALKSMISCSCPAERRVRLSRRRS